MIDSGKVYQIPNKLISSADSVTIRAWVEILSESSSLGKELESILNGKLTKESEIYAGPTRMAYLNFLKVRETEAAKTKIDRVWLEEKRGKVVVEDYEYHLDRGYC